MPDGTVLRFDVFYSVLRFFWGGYKIVFFCHDVGLAYFLSFQAIRQFWLRKLQIWNFTMTQKHNPGMFQKTCKTVLKRIKTQTKLRRNDSKQSNPDVRPVRLSLSSGNSYLQIQLLNATKCFPPSEDTII